MYKSLYEDLYLTEESHWWHVSKRRIVKEIIRKYNLAIHPKILDIGCGTGKNIEQLQSLGIVYGLDNSPQAINFCLKRGLRNIKLGQAEKINFPNNYFDIVTVLDVLEHADDKLVLKEINRVLKKNGLIIITVPAFSWLWSKWDEALHHKRRYTREKLHGNLINNSFNILRSTYLYSFLVLPAFIIRKTKMIFSKNFYTSDFKLSNKLMNFLLGRISLIEFFFARRFLIPFGTSILVVARKNA